MTGKFLEGKISGETDDGMNYGNETCFVFNLDEDPFEQINLWDRVPFQKIKRTLSSKVCDYWTNKMVDSIYQVDVSGVGKADLVTAFEANDDYITWWEYGTVNLTSTHRIQDLDSAGSCPFEGLAGDVVTGLPPADARHQKSLKNIGSEISDTAPAPDDAPDQQLSSSRRSKQ